MPGAFTLPKEERLSSKIALSALVSEGRYGRCGCLKFCYRPGNGEMYNRIVVSVPKRHFRRAVKRNFLKRRIREAYRTNKRMLRAGGRAGWPGTDILFIYNVTELMPADVITSAVREVLAYISEDVAGR